MVKRVNFRVSGREVTINDDGTEVERSISRQSTLTSDIQDDDFEEEVVTYDGRSNQSQKRHNSDSPVVEKKHFVHKNHNTNNNKTTLPSVEITDVSDDLAMKDVILEEATDLTINNSSSPSQKSDVGRKSGLVRRTSGGKGGGRHRLSINVTSAVEASRTSSSIISTPTPVITAG